MSKKKSIFKNVIAWILIVAVIGTVVAGIIAYNKNNEFKSKVDNILQVETTNGSSSLEKEQVLELQNEISQLSFSIINNIVNDID